MPAPLSPLLTVADEAIKSWPDVRAKQVSGHRGYVRSSKMFAFVVGDGLAFKIAKVEDAEKLYAAGTATPFVYNGSMEMRAWPVLPVRDEAELSGALTAARGAYETIG